MSHRQSILTEEDIDDFLIYLYFGKLREPLTTCLDRAYLDFSRTLHGIGQLHNRASLHKEARDLVWTEVDKLRTNQPIIIDQGSFDSWHKNSCIQLTNLYTSFGHIMYIGQAQKWLNMTIKYIFTLGDKRLLGFNHIYHLSHVPLDTIIVDKLRKYDAPKLTKRWSRIENYDKYFSFQQWIRSRFPIAPLDVEFLLWLGKDSSKHFT